MTAPSQALTGQRHITIVSGTFPPEVNGVDCPLFSPGKRNSTLRESWGLKTGGPAIMYSNRVAAEKNPQLAVFRYERLKSLHPPTECFTLVGGGPMRSRLVERHPDYIFIGIQRGESLAEHYASGDLFLFPSKTDTFGNVVTEAMTSDLAVVASDDAATNEHAGQGDNGLKTWLSTSPQRRVNMSIISKVSQLFDIGKSQLFDIKTSQLFDTTWPHLFDTVDQREFLLCQSINRLLRYRHVRRYFSVVSRLGDGWLWYLLILGMPVIFPAQGLSIALAMVTTGLLCTLIYKLLKHRLVRERPFISFQAINCEIPPLDRYSFPSGHTLHAVCFNTMLAVAVPGLAWLLLPFTLSVAASRVVLGLHYPTDVAAGAVLGGFLALVLTQPLINLFIQIV